MTQVKTKKIGLIGLGSMGKPMAINLLKANFPLTVYDIREEPLVEVKKLGAKVAKNAQEVGTESDTVIVMVLNYRHMQEAVLPPAGVLSGMKRGSTLIVTSTIAPHEVEAVEKVARESGVTVIDAPVSGGRIGAEDGSLAIMIGGDDKAIHENEAIFSTLGKNIYHVGKVGQGQVMKMINQILYTANLVTLAEALVIAKKFNMDLKQVLEVQSNGSADSRVLRTCGPRILARDFEPKGAVDVLTKDTRIIMNTGLELDVPLPVSSLSYQLYRIAASRGLGREDGSAVIKVFEDFAGVTVSG
jgi:3-hydroxyisobutyrate dehydrogenase-like beta-hydroxyacid dehydrogenase